VKPRGFGKGFGERSGIFDPDLQHFMAPRVALAGGWTRNKNGSENQMSILQLPDGGFGKLEPDPAIFGNGGFSQLDRVERHWDVSGRQSSSFETDRHFVAQFKCVSGHRHNLYNRKTVFQQTGELCAVEAAGNPMILIPEEGFDAFAAANGAEVCEATRSRNNSLSEKSGRPRLICPHFRQSRL